MNTDTYPNWIPPEPLVEELAAMSAHDLNEALFAIRRAVRDWREEDAIDAARDSAAATLKYGSPHAERVEAISIASAAHFRETTHPETGGDTAATHAYCRQPGCAWTFNLVPVVR